MERSLDVKNLVFDRTDFWIQLHDLSIGNLNVRVARDVVSIAGVVVGTDAGSDECEESYFMRVRCGRLTHHDEDCLDGFRRKGAAKTADQQFGSWLRANTPNLAKKSMVRVTGYEEEIKEDAATC
uniref:Uncharacterized protein n=1 Tax=Quercus lobata TaxID=97700 RepID=A0A7N2KWI6_QUELO